MVVFTIDDIIEMREQVKSGIQELATDRTISFCEKTALNRAMSVIDRCIDETTQKVKNAQDSSN